MSWVDIAILVIIVLSVLLSTVRGFAKDAISLAAWILAFIIAITLGDKFALILPQSIEQPQLRLGISVAVLFIATLIMGGIANFILAGFINVAHLKNIDRSLGALFGFIRGVVIICLLVVLGAFIELQSTPWWQSSAFLPMAEAIIKWLLPILPEGITHLIKL